MVTGKKVKKIILANANMVGSNQVKSNAHTHV